MVGRISLQSGIGEVMAPRTLVCALTVDLDGRARVDPGALHGRSELEQTLQWAARDALGPAQSCWIVWLAVELDGGNQPVRYKGLSACELRVNPQTRAAHKSMAELTNRMSEAMRGQVDVSRLSPAARRSLAEQVRGIDAGLWDGASPAFRGAVAA